MTRRDHCLACGDLVSDYDVTCTECGHCYCADCIEPYDAMTRLSQWLARDRGWYTAARFTDDAVQQLLKDLNSDQMNAYMNETWPDKDAAEDKDVAEEGNNKKDEASPYADFYANWYAEARHKFMASRSALSSAVEQNPTGVAALLAAFLGDNLHLDENLPFRCQVCPSVRRKPSRRHG